MAKIVDELPVKVTETEEAADVAEGRRLGPVLDGFDLLGIDL